MDPKTLEILLSIVPGVVLARVGTAALKAVGYQVLDVPGTWALKDACLRKPEAAVLRVANPVGSSGLEGSGFISRGPGCQDDRMLAGPATSARTMGLTSMQSLSNEDKSGTLFLPFLAGSLAKPKLSGDDPGRIRLSILESPLYLLPTRLLLRSRLSAESDQLELCCRWLADADTATKHKSAAWVMQDRFMQQTIKFKTKGEWNKSWHADAARDALMNLLLWRLNVAQTSAASLWWQGQPETVCPHVKGWVAALTVKDWPVFSSSSTDWNALAMESKEASLEGRSVTTAAANRANYLMVTPTFANPGRHTKLLASLTGGADALADAPLSTWMALAYSIAVPKELEISRVFETPLAWLSAGVRVKTPSLSVARGRPGDLRWHKDDKDSLTANIAVAKDIGHLTDTTSLSLCAGVEQKFSVEKMTAAAFGDTRRFLSLVLRFPRGVLQMALENRPASTQASEAALASKPRAAAELAVNMLPSRPRGSASDRDAVRSAGSAGMASTLVLGARWEQGKRLQYGAGIHLDI